MNIFFKKTLPVLFFLLCVASAVFPQSVSKKQDIAIFRLSYYGWIIPQALYEGIDEQILQNFENLKRFTIIAMNHRIGADSLEEFDARIRSSREQDAVVPEEVLMGQQAFTREDWEKAVNSYYLVVPIVRDYELVLREEKLTDGKIRVRYKARISVEFNIYSAHKKTKAAFFVIEKTAIDASPEAAFSSAIALMGLSLDNHLRRVPDFRIRTGIIKAEKQDVYFELGNDLGIKKGDEYVIIGYDEENNEKETGLVVVTDTKEDFSKSITLYTSQPIQLGDQAKEIPRLPVEFRAFVDSEIKFGKTAADTKAVFSPGLHISQTRGFYRFRPCYGIESNLNDKDNLQNGIPVSFLLGAELGNTYKGRFQILPTAQVFYTVLASSNVKELPKSAGAGIKAFVHTSYLISRDIKLGINAGFKAGFNFSSSEQNSENKFFRLILGIGLTIKM